MPRIIADVVFQCTSHGSSFEQRGHGSDFGASQSGENFTPLRQVVGRSPCEMLMNPPSPGTCENMS